MTDTTTNETGTAGTGTNGTEASQQAPETGGNRPDWTIKGPRG